MNHTAVNFLVLLLAGLLLSACDLAASTPADAPETPAVAEQATPMITATAALPTATKSPTSIPTSTPTVCLDKATPVILPPRKTPLEVKFISDGNIWLWQETEGIAHLISNTGDARSMSFSDDGQVIAFTRSKDALHVELWAINRDGSNLRRLVSVADLDAMGSYPGALANVLAISRWIPSTHTLIFVAYPFIDAIGDVEPYGQWAVDADTLKLQPWSASTQPPADGIGGMVSPDGRQIAIVTDITLSLVNADGTNRRDDVLTFPLIGLGHYTWIPPIVWSPDSKFIRAIISSGDPFAENATLTTWLIPTDGSPPQPLATFSGFPIDVDLSPNQQYIAFWKPIKYRSNVRELHLAKFDGSNEVVYYTAYVLEFKGWAPDSTHFVFWYGYGETKPLQLGHICRGFVPLADTPTDRGVTWVDSTRFLYVSVKGQIRELRLGRTDGSSILIGEFKGDSATYWYNRDSAAIGQTD